jgi:imidazolonepropionase-like amidohydrolase
MTIREIDERVGRIAREVMPGGFMSVCRIALAAVALPLALSLQLGAQGGARATLFEGARLIAGDGTAPVEDSAFLVQGGIITWVGRRGERQVPPGGVRVDLTGKTVMPSLIDGHNHMGLVNERDGSNEKSNYTRDNLTDQLQRYAYYGVSATLSMGLEADQELAYRLRDEVIPNAARFFTVGKGIAATPTAGPVGEARLGIPWGAQTENEGRRHVRELHARNVTFVKIWVDDREGAVPKLQPNVYRAIIQEAHVNGMEVIAHLSRTSALADAKDLFRAGVDGFVHTVRDRDVDDEYIALVKSHPKVWTGPNIPKPQTMAEIDMLADTLPANQIEIMRKGVAARMASGNPPSDLFELHCRNFRKIRDAHMIIGLGTDGTGDGFGAHEQIQAYVQCGMTPGEAIAAGTSVNARILHMDTLGSIVVGTEASFNVLNANPLDDITNSRKIAKVYLRGQEVDRAALKAKWTGRPGSK